MSVTITKVDGQNHSIYIDGEDVLNIMKGVYELIDKFSAGCDVDIWKQFKESPEAKSLYMLTREY